MNEQPSRLSARGDLFSRSGQSCTDGTAAGAPQEKIVSGAKSTEGTARGLYGLNEATPNVMWVDLNSAFATTEQQAHPSLRGRPMGVTNHLSPECCVIAASYEAKALGIKTGCRRSEAMALCPDFILLESDPPKYHAVYQKLVKIMKTYSPKVQMKSIDEGVIDFHGTLLQDQTAKLVEIGREIKRRVRAEIGSYMTVNIGLGPNWFLAKTAAGLHKPDGFDVIDHHNLIEVYKSLELQDLTGIADGYGSRLRAHNIFTPLQFLAAREDILRHNIFKSINGSYWYQRLRGYEVDDVETHLSMIGRQWVLHQPTNDEKYLRSSLHFLAETTGMKLRYRGLAARGAAIWLSFSASGGFYDRRMFKTSIYTDADIWLRFSRLFDRRPKHMAVRAMGLYLYEFTPSSRSQLGLFENDQKKDFLTTAVDEINDFYGPFTIASADALGSHKIVKQKVPFGGTEYFRLLLGN